MKFSLPYLPPSKGRKTAGGFLPVLKCLLVINFGNNTGIYVGTIGTVQWSQPIQTGCA